MTMDQRRESSSSMPEPAAQPPEALPPDALIRATLHEQAAGVVPAPDALARLNARLDAAAPPQRRWRAFRPRLLAAFAAALVVILVATPIGRLAAAGITGATQAIITTVREITTGNETSKTGSAVPGTASPAAGSVAVPLPTSGTGSPGARGTAPRGSTTAGTPTLPLGAVPSAGTVVPTAVRATVPPGIRENAPTSTSPRPATASPTGAAPGGTPNTEPAPASPPAPSPLPTPTRAP